MSATVTYPDIAHLITETVDRPSHVAVRFRCPVTGHEALAQGPWPADGLIERTAKSARRGLFSSVRSSLASSINQAIGSGSLQSIGSTVATQIIYSTGETSTSPNTHSRTDRENAIVAAFATVSTQFAATDSAGRLVSRTAAIVETTPFDEHLAQHPITASYDRDVLMRLLAQLIAADGTVTDDERATFAALSGGLDLAMIAARPSLSRVDFEETMQGADRESILLLGWAVALTDEGVSDAEWTLLNATAAGLAISETRVAELQSIARNQLISQAIASLAADGLPVDAIRSQVEALADRIGAGTEAGARAVIRWSKRNS